MNNGRDVVELLDALGVDAKLGAGGEAPFRCVFPEQHQNGDRSRSASINLTTGAWKCHGCGASGGGFDLAAVLRGDDEARVVSERYGFDYPRSSNGTTIGVRRTASSPRPRVDPEPSPIAEQETAAAHQRLVDTAGAIERLFELRGWTRDVIVARRIGLAGSRVTIPIVDPDDWVLFNLAFLPNPATRNNQRKMDSPAGMPRLLYPPPELYPPTDTLYIVEGEPDALAACSAGLSAVGVPGSQGWRAEDAERFAGRDVIVIPDADPSGRSLASKVAESLREHAARCRIVELHPDVESKADFTDFYAAHDFDAAKTQTALAELVRAADADLEQSDSLDWPDLVSLTSSLPAFPTDVFVEWLREYVEAEAMATQTPVDLAAFSVFGALSTATANRVEVRVSASWFEPVHVWTLVALPPAERKSAVHADTLRPIYRYEREERDRQAPEITALELREKVAKGRLKKAEDLAVKAVTSLDRIEADAALDTAQRELDEIVVPKPFQLVLGDVTPEAFGQALGDQGRITIANAEGGVFETFGGRYSQGVSNIDALLMSHSAEPLRITRLSRPQILIERACATLVFAVQPAVVSGLSRKPGFRGRGLLARFLYSMPRSAVGRRLTNPPAVPNHVKETYHRRIVELLDGLKPVVTDDGEERPHVLVLTPEAAAKLSAWRTVLEPQLGEAGRLGAISDWAGKLAGASVRVAGLLHVAEHGSAGTDEPINESTIDAALVVAEYLIPHARAALDLLDEDDVAADARTILSWLVEHHPETVSASDVVKAVSRIATVKDADPPLEMLERRGFLRTVQTVRPAGQVGRPPARRWLPNPKLWEPKNIGRIGKTPSETGFADFADVFGDAGSTDGASS